LWTRLLETAWPECKLAKPASESMIEKCENELSFTLPLPLLQLLRETDGVIGPNGEVLIFPIEEILDCNVDMWFNNEYEGVYLPFVSMLFFGSDQFDNLFAYPILGDRPDKSKVFRWIRDTDSRLFYANGLEQYFYMQWKCLEQSNPKLWDQTANCKDFDDFKTFMQVSQADFSPGEFSPDSMSG
jgi:hypothetical protein